MVDNANWEDEGNNEEFDDGSQGQDNGAIKALRQKAKADAVKVSSLESQVAILIAKDQERIAGEILVKKGVNPKAARLVLKDVTDVNEENVDAWLKDNGDLLNLGTQKPVEEGNESSSENDELGRQDALTSQANSPGTGGDSRAKINSFKTFEEINNWAQGLQK